MPDLSQNQYEMMPLAGVHVIIIHCSDTFTHQQNIIMYFIYWSLSNYWLVIVLEVELAHAE